MAVPPAKAGDVATGDARAAYSLGWHRGLANLAPQRRVVRPTQLSTLSG
jgi:hypothetical protein